MKHILTLLLAMSLCATVQAQVSAPADTLAEAQNPLKVKAEALDTVANRLFKEGDYLKCTDIRLQQLDLYRQLYGETDTTYIQTLVQLARCYYRDKRLVKTLETAQRAVDLYGQHHSTSDQNYAFFLDNLALYQASNKQPQEAYENCAKALKIYDDLGLHDIHLSIILMHTAENLSDLNRPQEAIRHELRALNIMRNEYGEHSEEYLGELPYLKHYYEQAGQDDKAQKLQQRLDKLKEEADQGIVDLPEPLEFTSAEQCHEHNADMLKYCDYFLNHYFSAPQMDQAVSYIMQWTTTSDDVNIVVGEDETKLLNTDKGLLYGISYLAGCSQYALELDSAQFSYNMYEHAMISMLNHYIANKKFTGEVAYLEKYLKAHEKGRDKLIEMLRKSYDKIRRDQEKGKMQEAE